MKKKITDFNNRVRGGLGFVNNRPYGGPNVKINRI